MDSDNIGDDFPEGEMIDFEDINLPEYMQLHRILSKTTQQPTEEWEIDHSKLQIKTIIEADAGDFIYGAIYDGRFVTVKARMVNEVEEEMLLLRELGAVWKTVDHPNVAKFIGASIITVGFNIDYCIVEEYVVYQNLEQILMGNDVHKLPFDDVISLALQSARGLSYLHSKNIVHYGVKTENMCLVDAKTRLKLTNFITSHFEAKSPMYHSTIVDYADVCAAPEVLRVSRNSKKSDVYSFGICLWQIYRCQLQPYAGLSPSEIVTGILNRNLRPVVPNDCPRSLESIIRKCWDVNPNRRPRMREVVSLLEDVNTVANGFH